ncbi:hypothetical protein FF1_018684 [Malus domestica]
MPNKNPKILPDDKSEGELLGIRIGEDLEVESADAGVSEDDVAVQVSIDDEDTTKFCPSQQNPTVEDFCNLLVSRSDYTEGQTLELGLVAVDHIISSI